MKINNATVEKLYNALTGLDGAMVGGSANVYTLAPVVRLKIARNLRTLRQNRNDYMVERNKLVMEFSEGTGKIDPKHPRWFEFAKRMSALDLGDQEVELERLSVQELDLDKNPIPPTVLSNLDELLDLSIEAATPAGLAR